MSYVLTIRPKSGMLQARPGLSALQKHFGAAYHIGSVGDYATYSSAPPVPDQNGETACMVHGGGANIGRGFHMRCAQDGSCTLTTPLPTTSHDLEDLFAFAATLAEFLGALTLEADGRAVPRTGLAALFAGVCRQNAEALQHFVAAEQEPVLSAVRMPLYLPENLCRRIAGVPPANGVVYLSTYLAERQAVDYTWLRPVFSQNSRGEAIGTYVLDEERQSVVPKTPFVPKGAPSLEGVPVAGWQVTLAPGGGPPLATLPYERLTAYLEALNLLKPFDERHWLARGLSLNRMRHLADEAQNA